MSPAEFYRELERHDWFHAMSDDHRVWASGDTDWRRLESIAKQVEGGEELMREYSKHVFSGESFGTPKHPKPEMPAEVVP